MTLSKLNYVNAGANGTFEASGEVRSTPEDVDTLIEYLRSSGKQRVVVHLHGGLISESKGMAIAEKIFPVYSAGLVLGTVLTVIITTTIVSFLPARKIAKMNPTDALRGKIQ